MIEQSSLYNVNWKKMGNLGLVLTPQNQNPKCQLWEMCLPSNVEEKSRDFSGSQAQ